MEALCVYAGAVKMLVYKEVVLLSPPPPFRQNLGPLRSHLLAFSGRAIQQTLIGPAVAWSAGSTTYDGVSPATADATIEGKQ